MIIDGMRVNYKKKCLLLMMDDTNNLEERINEYCMYFLNKDYLSDYKTELNVCIIFVRFDHGIDQETKSLLEKVQTNVAPLGITISVEVRK